MGHLKGGTSKILQDTNGPTFLAEFAPGCLLFMTSWYLAGSGRRIYHSSLINRHSPNFWTFEVLSSNTEVFLHFKTMTDLYSSALRSRYQRDLEFFSLNIPPGSAALVWCSGTASLQQVRLWWRARAQERRGPTRNTQKSQRRMDRWSRYNSS